MLAVPYKDAVAERKKALSRSHFNDCVWDRFLDRYKVDRKLRKGFVFHHEIHTDGIPVSILYARPKPDLRPRNSPEAVN